MTRWTDRLAMRGVTPKRLAEYLARTGWQQQDFPRRDTLVFEGPDDDSGKPIACVFSAENGDSFLTEAIRVVDTLTLVEDKPHEQIAADIAGRPSNTDSLAAVCPRETTQLAQDLAVVYDQDVLLTQLREMAQMEGRRRALYQERQAAAARLMAAAGRKAATSEERGKAGAEASQLTAQSEALLWEADDIRRRAGILMQRASGVVGAPQGNPGWSVADTLAPVGQVSGSPAPSLP